ncbi:STAS domain-containing protein [Kitasatospora sp. NPDC096128]|uniref:STAS domain-containing protein n=1 Tax=Kitasatospora sp. NPDC096128 TaxID=3155547 RepID=UPI0033304FB5
MTGPAEDSVAEQGLGGLQVRVERKGTVRILALAGELDHDTVGELRAALVRRPDDGIDRIVVDLDGLRFCDSSGLNALLRARIDGEAAGSALELAAPRPAVARLLAVTGADSVLRVHPDVTTALKAPGPGERHDATPTQDQG